MAAAIDAKWEHFFFFGVVALLVEIVQQKWHVSVFIYIF